VQPVISQNTPPLSTPIPWEGPSIVQQIDSHYKSTVSNIPPSPPNTLSSPSIGPSISVATPHAIPTPEEKIFLSAMKEPSMVSAENVVPTSTLDVLTPVVPTTSNLSAPPKYTAPKLADTVIKKQPKELPPLSQAEIMKGNIRMLGTFACIFVCIFFLLYFGTNQAFVGKVANAWHSGWNYVFPDKNHPDIPLMQALTESGMSL